MKKLFCLFLILAALFFVFGRNQGDAVDAPTGPAITRADAHALIDQAFDLIDASAGRIILQPSNALRSDLSAKQANRPNDPPKIFATNHGVLQRVHGEPCQR